MTKRKTVAPAARLRCAIYTRKSSEEGLDQSYNSLHAQRDACEAYVMSQAGEGWSALATHYDDGGYSGGSMERPGLKQLLADIERGKIDVVVVYKVDRLTRSLTDFAKIVDTFDAHGVSFVSVTQAFNTTSSMGRLTLNVLLSFAQFEREVTGERIRDKIAASKRKGMWMGGTPPLGYGHKDRALVVLEDEARTLRHIYERYLALGSVRLLRAELEAQGIRSPGRRTGTPMPFARGAIYHLLTNRLYLGEIVHKGEVHPGQHSAILERELFERVGAMLAAKRHSRRADPIDAARAPLTGLLFDARGAPMTPISTRNRHGRIYRYYVSHGLQTGDTAAGQGTRLPATTTEALLADRLRKLLPDIASEERWQSIGRIEVREQAIAICLRRGIRVQPDALAAPDQIVTKRDHMTVLIAGGLRRWRGRSEIVRPDNRLALTSVRPDRAMIKGIGRAHVFAGDVERHPFKTICELAAARQTREPYFRRLMQLAFLAPDIQQAILDGTQPRELSLERLMKQAVPMGWDDQRMALGFGRKQFAHQNAPRP